MPSLPLDLLKNFEGKALEALAREPANLDEALVRMMVVCGNLWMMGAEPVSSELDRLLNFWVSSLRWDEKAGAKLLLHQLRKTREGVRRAQGDSGSEAGSTGTGGAV